MRRMRGIKVPPMKGVKIDEIAALSRRRLAPTVTVDQPVDMLQVLEDFDGKDVRVPSVGTAKTTFAIERLPGHVMARTMLTEGRIVVGLNERTHDALRFRDEGWARFTVPHELGHVKLHLEPLARLTELPHDALALARANPSHRIFEDSEWQADRLAAAFMAPDAGLRFLQRKGDLNVQHVMATFGMARSTASIRIENFLRAERERNEQNNNRRRGR